MLWSEAVLNLLSKLVVRKDAVHFFEAVDWEAHGGVVDDFPVIVKHESMHLSLIKQKVDNNEYVLPKDVDLDMQTIFKNAQIYNQQNSTVYLDSLSLAKYWDFNWTMISNDTTACADSASTGTLQSHCVVNRPRIKLVALDLDGTLLDNDHHLSQRNIDVLRKLSDAGVIICLASGRNHTSMQPYWVELNLSQEVVPVVCYNGAIGFKYTRVNKEAKEEDRARSAVFSTEVSEEAARLLIAFAQKNNYLVQYYIAETGEVYCVPTNDTHRQLMAKYRNYVTRDHVVLENYDQAIAIGRAPKALILDFNTTNVMNAALDQIPYGTFNMFRGSPDPFFVEFLNPEASKGNGLSQVCAHLNISMDQVAAFGDGENDKEMLALSGCGIAMRNAKAEAKLNSSWIMEWTNEEDGVARQLEAMIEEGYFGDI